MTSHTSMDDERKGLPSASSWRRYELCHGSYQLEKEAKRIGQSAHGASEWAEMGKGIHARLEGKEVKLSESEAQTAQLLKERGDEQIERIFQGEEYAQVREKRLWLKVNDQLALSGRFDVVSYTRKVALVQDYKTGFTPPEAEDQNAQMGVLAVLVALAMLEVEEVVCQIVSGPFGISEFRYDLQALGKAYNQIVDVLEAINAEDAPLAPGVEQCRHCGAKLICQAVKDTVVRPLTKLQMSALPADGPQAAKLLDEVEIMASLLKEIKKFYAGKFEDPTYTIPGYQMVPGATVREVTDWETARSRLSEFLPIQQLNSAADYRLGELEKSLGKALKLKAPQAKEKMNQILDGLVKIKENSASLKRVKGNPALTSLRAG